VCVCVCAYRHRWVELPNIDDLLLMNGALLGLHQYSRVGMEESSRSLDAIDIGVAWAIDACQHWCWRCFSDRIQPRTMVGYIATVFIKERPYFVPNIRLIVDCKRYRWAASKWSPYNQLHQPANAWINRWLQRCRILARSGHTENSSSNPICEAKCSNRSRRVRHRVAHTMQRYSVMV
jgi:hypothetical protein